MRLSRVIAVGCLAAILASGTALAASSSADERIAHSGVVVLHDLTSGWTAEPQSTGGGLYQLTPKLVSTIPACKPLRPLLGANQATAAAESSDFIQGVTTFTNSVSVYANAKRAELPIAVFKGTAFGQCFGEVVKKGLKERAAKTKRIAHATIMVQQADPGTNVGDDQAAVAATVNLQVRGQRAAIYFKIIVVRVGRAVDSFGYQDDSNPISDTMNNVITASVSRLRTAVETSRTSAH